MEKDKHSELPGGHQSDLAEGEVETVEESIRIHERKADVQGQNPASDKKDAA